jgi:hypothetical protein
MMGTHWELEKNPPPPNPPKKRKKKYQGTFECMLSLSIGCMKSLFPKLFVTTFGLV